MLLQQYDTVAKRKQFAADLVALLPPRGDVSYLEVVRVLLMHFLIMMSRVALNHLHVHLAHLFTANNILPCQTFWA